MPGPEAGLLVVFRPDLSAQLFDIDILGDLRVWKLWGILIAGKPGCLSTWTRQATVEVNVPGHGFQRVGAVTLFQAGEVFVFGLIKNQP
jgi:hypothetical protein